MPGLDYVRAEVIHAARNEMALTVDDILSRRTAPGSSPATRPPTRPTTSPR